MRLLSPGNVDADWQYFHWPIAGFRDQSVEQAREALDAWLHRRWAETRAQEPLIVLSGSSIDLSTIFADALMLPTLDEMTVSGDAKRARGRRYKITTVSNTGSLSFRLMSDNDLDAVCELEARAYEFPWSRAIISGCRSVQYRIWLGELVGQLRHVSQAFLSITLDEAHILNLAVEPHLQDRGLGSQTLRFLVEDPGTGRSTDIFRSPGVKSTGDPNVFKSGFNEIGRRRHYYPTKMAARMHSFLGWSFSFD